jgi:gas vesicle structural protein
MRSADHGPPSVLRTSDWQDNMSDILSKNRELDLADLLDRALGKGIVIWGEATISLAGVDLVYLGLKVLIASYDTVMGPRELQAAGQENVDNALRIRNS